MVLSKPFGECTDLFSELIQGDGMTAAQSWASEAPCSFLRSFEQFVSHLLGPPDDEEPSPLPLTQLLL